MTLAGIEPQMNSRMDADEYWGWEIGLDGCDDGIREKSRWNLRGSRGSLRSAPKGTVAFAELKDRSPQAGPRQKNAAGVPPPAAETINP
jgi:hypothetical protein